MDTLTEMRGTFGRMHEFLIALEKAGFTEETIVEIINSSGNKLAGEMFNSLPERLRTKWNIADLKLIFKLDKENIRQKFLKSLSSNYDEGLIAGGRALLNRKISKEEINDQVFRFINVNNAKEISEEEIECHVFHFNYVISNRDAIKEMFKKGYRPATEYETLTFCELNEEWAKHYQVCALGVKYKEAYFSIFHYSKDKKRLWFKAHYDENDCAPSMRFLGVKIR